MLFIEIVDWVWEHRGEVTINALLLLILRKFIIKEFHKVLHLGREGELMWLLLKVEELTGEKYDGQPAFLKTVKIRYTKKYYFYLRKAIDQVYPKRRTIMTKALTSNISKKLIAFLVAAAVTTLNTKLGLDLNPDTIYGIIALAIAYIAGQSHVDAKKAISNAVNAASTAVVQAAATTDGSPISTIIAPPMSYDETMKMIGEVHTDINRIFADAKNKDNVAAMNTAINSYMSLHQYFTKNEVNP